jgi:hypothetical protein
MATIKDAIASMAKNIEGATGKKISEWAALVRASGFAKHGERVKWLKEKHGIGHGHATYLAHESLKEGEGEVSDEALLAAQFAGKKAAVKPLYDKLVALAQSLGKDVEISPKKNNVSLRRKKQFGLLQASTATRLDLGLILPDVKPAGRLEASGSFNGMFTHRVRIGAASEIDAELKRWLKQAYEAA